MSKNCHIPDSVAVCMRYGLTVCNCYLNDEGVAHLGIIIWGKNNGVLLGTKNPAKKKDNEVMLF